MPTPKSATPLRGREALRYRDHESLRAAVLAYCRKDWKQRTSCDWNDEHTAVLRAELDRDLRAVRDAQAALVAAFVAANKVASDYPKNDPRVAHLRDFLATISDKTRGWIRIFYETTAPEVASDLGFVVDATPPDGRTRMVLFEMSHGRGDDPALLARLSLLLGYFPRDMPVPATVARVVDLERKAMAQAIKRAKAWLWKRRFQPERRPAQRDGPPVA